MAKKSFKTNNLVIICEGTETEQPYFEYLANKVRDQFDDIKVIPSPEEKLAAEEVRANQNRRMKQLASENNERAKKAPLYVTRPETEPEIDANYDKYKQAPAKYVREAYFWTKNDVYSEAWAVYDLDDTDDTDHSIHECAKKLMDNTPSLHIAFSAYSFEEWLLLHFERCNTEFRNSAYKKAEGKKHINDPEYDCNGRQCQHKKKCEAECLGDYLGRQGYVDAISKKYNANYLKKINKVYSKNDGRIYAQAIYEDEKLRHRAYVNAAWSRSIKKASFFDCNPYSDVDQLIMRLMDEKKEICWVKTNESFTLGVHSFTIKQEEGSLYLSHQGNVTCVLYKDQIFWCDDDYNKKAEAINGININYTVNGDDTKSLVVSNNCNILCIKDGNQEFYFERQ